MFASCTSANVSKLRPPLALRNARSAFPVLTTQPDALPCDKISSTATNTNNTGVLSYATAQITTAPEPGGVSPLVLSAAASHDATKADRVINSAAAAVSARVPQRKGAARATIAVTSAATSFGSGGSRTGVSRLDVAAAAVSMPLLLTVVAGARDGYAVGANQATAATTKTMTARGAAAAERTLHSGHGVAQLAAGSWTVVAPYAWVRPPPLVAEAKPRTVAKVPLVHTRALAVVAATTTSATMIAPTSSEPTTAPGAVTTPKTKTTETSANVPLAKAAAAVLTVAEAQHPDANVFTDARVTSAAPLTPVPTQKQHAATISSKPPLGPDARNDSNNTVKFLDQQQHQSPSPAAHSAPSRHSLPNSTS